MVPSGTEETICRLVETYSDMLLRLAATRLSSPADADTFEGRQNVQTAEDGTITLNEGVDGVLFTLPQA